MATAGLTDIIDDLDDLTGSDDEVSVGDVVEKIGHRGTGALLLVPGLIGVSPLAGVPSVPTILAAIVVLLSVQIVIGRKKPWLPSFLSDRSVSDDRLKGAVDKCRGAAKWLDRWFGGRLEPLTGDVAMRIAAAICVILAAMTPPLELVPLAAALPMAAIAAFGLALTLRDGAVMLVAFAVSATALYGAWTMMP